MSSRIVIPFPKRSKSTRKPNKKKPPQKCTVLEWIRNESATK